MTPYDLIKKLLAIARDMPTVDLTDDEVATLNEADRVLTEWYGDPEYDS